jgi:hypothetical protein
MVGNQTHHSVLVDVLLELQPMFELLDVFRCLAHKALELRLL